MREEEKIIIKNTFFERKKGDRYNTIEREGIRKRQEINI